MYIFLENLISQFEFKISWKLKWYWSVGQHDRWILIRFLSIPLKISYCSVSTLLSLANRAGHGSGVRIVGRPVDNALGPTRRFWRRLVVAGGRQSAKRRRFPRCRGRRVAALERRRAAAAARRRSHRARVFCLRGNTFFFCHINDIVFGGILSSA